MQVFDEDCNAVLVWNGEFGERLRDASIMMLVQEDADFVPRW